MPAPGFGLRGRDDPTRAIDDKGAGSPPRCRRAGPRRGAILWSTMPISWLRLLAQDEGVVRPLLQKAGLNLTAVTEAVERELARFPTQSGGGAEPSFSREIQRIFDRADAEAREARRPVHLHRAPAPGDGRGEGHHRSATFSARQNISADDLRPALQEVRGSHRVTDQSPEEKYQALEKYTRNLTEEARKGKLDPVIGRDEEIRRCMQVLSRRTKNNPVLIGEPGRREDGDRGRAGPAHRERRRARIAAQPRAGRRSMSARCWPGPSSAANSRSG